MICERKAYPVFCSTGKSSFRRSPTAAPDRSANLLVKRHGQDAPIEAAMRADAMLDKGNLAGYAAWKRILRAVGELQGTEIGVGSRIH